MSQAPRTTLILGGARSGKSLRAQALAEALRPRRRYVATAQALDDEMRERIALHRADRDDSWITSEAPLDLAAVLRGAVVEEVLLIDCLTLWLTNHLLAGSDLDQVGAELAAAVTASPALVIVANEVGFGIVPDNALARRFRDAAGRLNQRLAATCDRVELVVAGLPLRLKG